MCIIKMLMCMHLDGLPSSLNICLEICYFTDKSIVNAIVTTFILFVFNIFKFEI